MKVVEPAFPTGSRLSGYCGMSLRDYFAAKALHGVLVTAEVKSEGVPIGQAIEQAIPVLARFSYAMADAMLAARGSHG